jgi:hypothetical protein
MNDESLKQDLEKMKSIPWDYSHLKQCPKCGSADDQEIFECDDGNFNFYCASVSCAKCAFEVNRTEDESADLIWNRGVT